MDPEEFATIYGLTALTPKQFASLFRVPMRTVRAMLDESGTRKMCDGPVQVPERSVNSLRAMRTYLLDLSDDELRSLVQYIVQAKDPVNVYRRVPCFNWGALRLDSAPRRLRHAV